MYIDRQELATLIGIDDLPVTGAALAFTEGADRDAVRERAA